jgi:hypothetical protein
MVITGGRTETGTKLAAHGYRLMLEKIPQPVYDKKTGKFVVATLEDYTSFNGFKVVNIVGSGKLFQNNQVKLGSLSKDNINLTGWDEKIFPGLRFTILRDPVGCPIRAKELMAHIFQGANDVIMGARVKEDIYKAHIFLQKTIAKYLSNPVLSNANANTSTSTPAYSYSSTSAPTPSPTPSTRTKRKKQRGNIINVIEDAAKEHTKMLQSALKSRENILFGGINKTKTSKKQKHKATKIKRPKTKTSGMGTKHRILQIHEDEDMDIDTDTSVDADTDDTHSINEDEDDENIDENQVAHSFTKTSAIAIAGEVPEFIEMVNDDYDVMNDFMDEFEI